jgi:hypothetical protein
MTLNIIPAPAATPSPRPFRAANSILITGRLEHEDPMAEGAKRCFWSICYRNPYFRRVSGSMSWGKRSEASSCSTTSLGARMVTSFMCSHRSPHAAGSEGRRWHRPSPARNLAEAVKPLRGAEPCVRARSDLSTAHPVRCLLRKSCTVPLDNHFPFPFGTRRTCGGAARSYYSGFLNGKDAT